jgi:hypothetical protein
MRYTSTTAGSVHDNASSQLVVPFAEDVDGVGLLTPQADGVWRNSPVSARVASSGW